LATPYYSQRAVFASPLSAFFISINYYDTHFYKAHTIGESLRLSVTRNLRGVHDASVSAVLQRGLAPARRGF